MADDTVTVPSTPNPVWTTLVGTGVRGILQFISAGMALFGTTCSFCSPSASAVATFAGAAVFLGTLGWSYWQKFRAAQKDHAGSVASANAGVALKAVS
jgi:hypothetical protein